MAENKREHLKMRGLKDDVVIVKFDADNHVLIVKPENGDTHYVAPNGFSDLYVEERVEEG